MDCSGRNYGLKLAMFEGRIIESLHEIFAGQIFHAYLSLCFLLNCLVEVERSTRLLLDRDVVCLMCWVFANVKHDKILDAPHSKTANEKLYICLQPINGKWQDIVPGAISWLCTIFMNNASNSYNRYQLLRKANFIF